MRKLWVLFICFLSQPVFASEDFLPQGFCSQEIDYTYYSICYEPTHRQASWVKHTLTLENISGSVRRTNDYRRDPNLEDPVTGRDYRGSGFDRGHLAPAADMKLNHQMMSESFYMTNMSPQRAGFNRGIWVAIEKKVRRLVRDRGTAHVITAPVLDISLPAIDSGVSIPRWYYKIAYFPDEQEVFAYLIENQRFSDSEPADFQVSVDEIEQLTGFDFFADLPDTLEDSIECQIFSE